MVQIVIENANEQDVPAIAALFTESFKESVLHHCGRLPKPLAMQDVFSLVYQAEPAAAFVARSGSEVIGYCFAPVNLSALWMRAITGGHIIKWAWRWLTGRYGFGLHPVKIIILNKIAFLCSSVKPGKAANARILSIAVAESYRGQGVASRLMKAALEYFKANNASLVRLEVRPDNAPAVKVYKNLGFVEGGTTRDSQGDWLIMFKEME
ncbi:MAG: GNAT family N-acetyltransferase [Veillonellaceae bacterium]|jgi:ribosomal-protein-alanine N-acetyltransferase|nr:GNAT family N-acetyltransferase [Veillonellaceae bacterium]